MNKLQSLISFIKRHIKQFYYLVPQCPACRSPVTGRFTKLHRDTVSEWQINESLKHGELIRPVQEMTNDTCFCVNCGYEWPGLVEFKLLSIEEIEKEKSNRLTREILNERILEERKRLRNDHSPLKPIKRFIGKL